MDFSITTQKQLEKIFSKHQLLTCIKHEFITSGITDEMENILMPVHFGLDLMAQMVLHKRCSITTMVGLLKKHYQASEKPAQDCTDMILHAVQKDLVDWDDPTQTLIMKYDITDDVKMHLDMFQYPLPMIESPDEVKNNRQTGYQTISGSLILRDNHHDDDICLDHINRVNAIPLALNADVVAFVQNQWKNLDKPKEGEMFEDFKKRVRAFDKYDRTSRDVIAALMAQGDRFWLTHKYDKRGRSYAQGYHVNYQGNDWNKAVVEFADAEPLNSE